MRTLLRLAPALLMAGALEAQAPAPNDPALDALIREALDSNPQLKAAQASRDAEQTKVPQAGALPDPMVTLSYQNDGFKGFTYGQSPFAFGQVGLSQAFPYPGKRKLRARIAEAGVAAADAAVERVRLDLIASVKRDWIGLLQIRGQRALLDAQALLWKQVAGAAEAKVSVGAGEAADLLRAQLEQARIAQRGADLEARESALVADLDRLAGRAPGSALETREGLDAMPLPDPPAADAADQVLAASPELSEARHHLAHYEQQVSLAKLDLRPDFTVGAAYMPQGSMPGMWSVSVGFSVPLWAGRKQRQAVAGARAEAEMQDQRIADIRQRLASATEARAARLKADLEVARLYKGGILAQSDAAFQAELARFANGAAPFRAVLEALSDRLKDRSGYLDALAQAHVDAIELERAAPDGVPAPAATPNPMSGGAE